MKKIFACDFETTVYDNQEYTEVWASGCAELYTDNVNVFHSIDEQFEYFKSLRCNLIVYFHNLKFDGEFILYWLLKEKNFTQACISNPDDINDFTWLQRKDMPNNSFTYRISQMGLWYNILIKTGGYFIEIRDSLKLLPFTLREIGLSFGTKHQKTEMEYEGYRYSGCVITDSEKEYIVNDVLVLKEALEIVFNEGHNKLTIGACCLHEYKKIMGRSEFSYLFPDLHSMELDRDKFGSSNIGLYIKKSYHGGWVYVNPHKTKKIVKNGVTFDVNSLYPSMMSSESGNRFPVGHPIFWSGNYIPIQCMDNEVYYFIRFKCRFNIKKGYLPFVQIKHNGYYSGTECLETSDIYNKETKQYCKYIKENDEIKLVRPTLTMTVTDFKLFQEHYNIEEMEILDGCYFMTEIGIFDKYIEKYKQIKQTTDSASRRQLAKLFLNNLYGKMATSTDSSFKVAYLNESGTISYYCVLANDKKGGYIPIGSAITSYARNFTIRASQKNYNGKNGGFIYADTDSMHLDLKEEEVKGIRIHDKDFCCWKKECEWDYAIFVRPKTYIEHIIQRKDGKTTYKYDVKCAGMPQKCKDLFVHSLEQDVEDYTGYNEKEILFMQEKRTLEDFNIGLIVPSKLLPKRIKGGIVLSQTTYEMR